MEELKAQEAEALDILEAMLDVCDLDNPGPMFAGQHVRGGICKIMDDDATKLRQYIADRRTVPENKPLTLEQLRKMDGEPVWIKGSDAKTSGWALIKGKREKQIANCPDDWNISYYMKDYGKTWLPYARRQEGSETGG